MYVVTYRLGTGAETESKPLTWSEALRYAREILRFAPCQYAIIVPTDEER